jgi:hypothetical protein
MKSIFEAPFRAIYRMFLWSSGADLEVLDQAPTDKNKFFGIGGTIVFTALMATFAGGYAFYTAFDDYTASIFFGLFWGALIFNLDRYIVSTFGVGDGKKTISAQELKEAFPRLIMAVLLGFVISTPLELKIFDKEISVEVEKLKILKGDETRLQDTTFYKDFAQAKIDLENVDKKLIYFQNAKKQLIADEDIFYKEQLVSLNDDRNRIGSELKIAKTAEANAYNNYIFAKRDTTDRFSTAQISRYNNLYQRKASEKKEIFARQKAINEDIKNLEENRDVAINDKREQIEQQLSQLTVRQTDLTGRVKTLQGLADQKAINNTNISENYDGFAAHLTALGKITEDSPAVWWAKWLITFLFVFIEISPILFKMMTERGPYDDIIDRIKHEKKVEQLLLQSNLNARTNTLVKLTAQKNEEYLRKELQENEMLMKTLAKAQAEIAAAAIEEWKEQQIQKAKNNPGTIINSGLGGKRTGGS